MINPWKPARRDPDLERIEQLYREYRLPLWRYAFKLLHDEHLADDVVQSVFIKAIEKIVEWLKKFSGWARDNKEIL